MCHLSYLTTFHLLTQSDPNLLISWFDGQSEYLDQMFGERFDSEFSYHIQATLGEYGQVWYGGLHWSVMVTKNLILWRLLINNTCNFCVWLDLLSIFEQQILSGILMVSSLLVLFVVQGPVHHRDGLLRANWFVCKLNVVHESCASKELVAGQCANKLYRNSNLVIMTILSIYCEVVNCPKCTIHESTKVDIPPIASYTSPYIDMGVPIFIDTPKPWGYGCCLEFEWCMQRHWPDCLDNHLSNILTRLGIAGKVVL